MHTHAGNPLLAVRLARHLGRSAAFAAGAIGAASAVASAQVVAWEDCNLVIPANIDGLYVNVETRAIGTAGSAVPGWDLNPYSSSSLTWYNATGTGMRRFPGVTTGSAGNLDIGTVVGASGSFGSGSVAFGTAAGNWRLNALNRFGFRFTASDGLTHYGWGTMQVGAAVTVRTLTSLYYEAAAGNQIVVGDVGMYVPCAPTNPALAVGANSVTLNQSNAPALDLTSSCGSFIHKANYFRFVAPESGGYLFSTCASGTSALLAVLADCSEGSPVLPGCFIGSPTLACGDGCGAAAGIWVELQAGQSCYCVAGAASAEQTLPSPLNVAVSRDECPCPGDVSGNGRVDSVDLAAVLSAWGTSGQGPYDTDVNDDGAVDGNDLAFVLFSWGTCP